MLKVFYHYQRTEKLPSKKGKVKGNAPIVTHCLVLRQQAGNTEYARGTAICSSVDNPRKEIGRGYAFDRAIEAFMKAKNFTQEPYLGKPENQRCFGFFKGEYMPALLEIERNLIFSKMDESKNG